MLDKMKILEVIDASQESCPAPLIQTKTYYEKAEAGTSFKIILGNEISALNVERFLKQNKCDYELIKESETRYLLYTDVVKAEKNLESVNTVKEPSLLYYIAAASVGFGDCELGSALLPKLIANIKNLDLMPKTLVFINTGVRALAENKEMQKDVQDLIDNGIKMFYCGACAIHFDVVDEIKIGTVSNLHEIMTLLGEHDRVV